jgi:hypothetical protein
MSRARPRQRLNQASALDDPAPGKKFVVRCLNPMFSLRIRRKLKETISIAVAEEGRSGEIRSHSTLNAIDFLVVRRELRSCGS